MIQAASFTPRLEVRVFKTVDRSVVAGSAPVSSRYSQLGTDPGTQTQGGQIDLTPFLGEQGGVRTTKSVREPAGGFTVTLSDQEFGVTLDSIYSALEPMDVVEIRMSHGALSDSVVPIVMRGFISEVSRSEGIGDDGRPSRQVVISGQDYGKIWQLIQVMPLAEFLLEPGKQLYRFPVLERFGISAVTTLKVDEFVSQLVRNVLNDTLSSIIPSAVRSRVPAVVDTSGVVVTGQRVSVPGLSNVNSGTLYELIRNFCDVGVWNELYLEDLENTVRCVLRPFPAIDVETGRFIQPVPGFDDPLPEQAPAKPAEQPAAPQASQSEAEALRAQIADREAQFRRLVESWTFEANLAKSKQEQAAAPGLTQAQRDALLAEAATITAEAKALYETDYNLLKVEIAGLKRKLGDLPEVIAPAEAAALQQAQAPKVPAGFVDISAAEIKSMQVSRSDANVANFFYTESQRFDLSRVAQLKIFQITEEANTVDFRFYGNSAADLYGNREMRAEVSTWPADVVVGTSGATKEQLQADEGAWRSHLREKRRILALQNKDNVVLESGTMRLAGRPDIRAGMFLRVSRGGLRYLVYVTKVDHEFVPFTSFFTTVTFERGTGFAERVRSGANTYNLERQ